jgi:amidase
VLGAGAAVAGAAVAAPWWDRLAVATGAPGGWPEATIAELQRAMASGKTTSRELTRWYLDQIARLNPKLHAVIETNPDALAIAAALDRERHDGHHRGPLHGLPILVKDNLATDDRMETTAGSLALVGSKVPDDSVVVAHLRRAGAVILGKANLSEWANFRGGSADFPPINGWSARGGFTRDPYVLSADPCGSSSGSAVGAAANLCVAAIGTETDGSITCPAGNNNVAGLKPTVGLVSQRGIIPIAASQDTAGPMARTVADVATILGVIQSPFPGPGLNPPAHLPRDYTAFLSPRALKGARIGIDRQYFDLDKQGLGPDDALLFDLDEAFGALRHGGATLIDDVDTGDFLGWFDAEFTVLLFEFKVQVAAYLAGLRNTRMRTLADLIRFNLAHCQRELAFFGQEVFEASEATSGNLRDPEYLAAVATCRQLTRARGIDRAFRQHNLDAVVGPSWSFISTAPAVAGYPNISVPAGFDRKGRPIGMSMFARAWEEPKLLGMAYAFEQVMGARRPPRFKGSVPPPPPPFPGCSAPTAAAAARASAARNGVRGPRRI